MMKGNLYLFELTLVLMDIHYSSREEELDIRDLPLRNSL